MVEVAQMRRLPLRFVWLRLGLLLLGVGWLAAPAYAAEPAVLLGLAEGNWAGDGCTLGGLDAGKPGDQRALVVSGKKKMDYPDSLEVSVRLDQDLSRLMRVQFEFGLRANTMQSSAGEFYWDGVRVADLNASGKGEELKTLCVSLDAARLNLKPGVHKLRLAARSTANEWDFLQLDAVRIGPADEEATGGLGGGQMIPYEVLPLANANWTGDANTWGGLDAAASLKGDQAAVILQESGDPYPRTLDVPVVLRRDFSRADAVVRVGLRRNGAMVREGAVYWDGKLLGHCQPFLDGPALVGRDSILDQQSFAVRPGDFALTPGEHTVRFEISSPPSGMNASFQVDALMIEAAPQVAKEFEIPLAECEWVAPALGEGIELRALRHFQEQAKALGGAEIVLRPEASAGARWVVRLGTLSRDAALERACEAAGLKSFKKGLKPFQQQESYVLALDERAEGSTLNVGGLGALGTVYAISDLELRLRLREGKLYLAFAEWGEAKPPRKAIFEKPALELRGEYMNVGYDLPNITPHGWSRERWHQYIDKLVLARLNHFYFYLWSSANTLYPGSSIAQRPENVRLHENLRDVIDYCHQRGLQVTFMICPSYFPGDVWQQHPEMHAEIEYVTHGFPVICPRAPGARKLMREVWEPELAWFAKADAVHVWFYDPGGCWCAKNGCDRHQAEDLADQMREYGELFRKYNPQGQLEYNLWPIWLWEETRKIKYRQDLDERMRKLYGEQVKEITVSGAIDAEITLPLPEQAMGFRTAVFLFGVNPESSYAFLNPSLTLLQQSARTIAAKGLTGAYGHRLEAWTRYPGTFFMGQFLWNPEVAPEEAVGRYGRWQLADAAAAVPLTEALLLLEQFSYLGGDARTGARMAELTRQALTRLPEAHRAELEYFQPMMEMLALIGQSIEHEDNAVLNSFAESFTARLQSSPTFAPLSPRARDLFMRYRGFLAKGWKKQPF